MLEPTIGVPIEVPTRLEVSVRHKFVDACQEIAKLLPT